MEFEEKEAVKAMREALSPEKSARYDDSELVGVLDIIFDWYEDNGYLDLNLDDDLDAEPDAEALIDYVEKMLRRDRGGVIDPSDAKTLVEAELKYEASLL